MSDFGSFEDFIARTPRAVLPESVLLLGYYKDGTRYVPFLLDGDNRLVMQFVTLQYYARSPKVIPSASAGILENAPGSGTKVITNINVVNVTANPVTLKLHIAEEEATNYNVFGICGGEVAANGLFQWEGELVLGPEALWGQAGTASALYATITMRDERDTVR